MKTMLTLIMLTLLPKIFAAGLSGGDHFSAQLISGRLQVSCMNGGTGPQSGYAICQSEILNPGEYSYFVGPKVMADKVSLRALREDGSLSKEKTESYNGSKGMSRRPFNLWISTVFQRPLLGPGKNVITYKLIKEERIIESGQFEVMVNDGGRAVCSHMGYYVSSSSLDCTSPEILCSRYFSEHNYCQ